MNAALSVSTNLFTLAVEVNEGVTGWRDVLGCYSLVHTIDIEMETTVGIHQQTQHRPLRTSVQVRTIVLTYLRRRRKNKENSWLKKSKKRARRGEFVEMMVREGEQKETLEGDINIRYL